MSWDIFIQDFPDVSNVEDIPEDFTPNTIGTREILIGQIKQVVPSVDFSDPSWGVLYAGDFTIEFNIGENENVECITCHIKGETGGGACVLEICKKLGLKALDSATGELLDDSNPELGFEIWDSYRKSLGK